MHHFTCFQSDSNGYIKLIENYTRNRALQSGKRLHAHLIITGLARSTHLASKLIALYALCHQTSYAHHLFDEIPQRHTRRWTVLIGAFARHGFHREAMAVFSEMQTEGLKPNRFLVPSVLKSCGHLLDRRTGEKLHGVVVKQGFESDVFVGSGMIDMYSRCGEVEKARRVFDSMVGGIDLVALNTMVAGYVRHGFVDHAVILVEKSRSMDIVVPDLVTWNTLIAGFAQANDDSNVAEVFRRMEESGTDPDVVSWTSVISGFVRNLRNREAFGAFEKMLRTGMRPTSATISSLLPACGILADSRRGKQIHGFSVVFGVEKDVFVLSALVDMYAKCGFIYEAKTLFEKTPKRTTITWNSMIFGFANHGHCNEAIALFDRMVDGKNKPEPDHLTFTAVLTACSQSGLTNLGKNVFLMMQERFKIQPRLEHYACLVHLLGREGKLAEAHDLIREMPIEPDVFVWGAFLGACKLHGNVDLAEMAAKRVAELEPESAGSRLLMSNLYADTGNWGYAARVKRTMRKTKLEKLAGSSWIGIA